MIKPIFWGIAMMGTMAISAPSLAATQKPAARVATTAQLETQHPAMQNTLHYSDQGHWVMTLQADLNDLGVNAGPVDGIFGPKTEAGVKAFQTAHKLPVTGVANAVTWQDILSGFNLVPPANGNVTGAMTAVTTGNYRKTSSTNVRSAMATNASVSHANMIDGRPILHVYHMIATAYGPSLQDNYPYGPTDAFGQPLKAGMIAVDPSVIPLKSTVYVSGYHDSYLPSGGFLGHAMDTGGAIQGMRIDVFMNDNAHIVSNFGVQPVTVYVLGK